jgi:hypothetical protein
MVSKQNGSTRAGTAPPPAGIPAAIASAVESAGGKLGPIVPAVQLSEFTISFPIDRLNSIVACMGGGPFNLVQDHIAWIQKQCEAQVAEAQKKANAAALGTQG